MPKKIKRIFLISIFLSAITLGISFLFTEMTVDDNDAYSRAIISTNERINRTEFFSFNPNRYASWLPLHFKILGASLTLYDNIFFSPRFITLIFSAGTAAFMYYYAFLITGSARISMLSSLLFLFFPQRIFLSTLTFSEPIFVFFLISALILIFKTPPNYWGGITLLNIAHGIRYESWLLLPLIWITVWKNRNRRLRPILILASSFFPIFWLFINKIFTGNPVYFLTYKYSLANSGEVIIPGHLNFFVAFSRWFTELSGILTIPGIVLIIYGWYRLVKIKKDWERNVLILIPFYVFFTLPLQVFLKTMEYLPARYLFIPTSLSFPLLGYGLMQFKDNLKSSSLLKHFPIYNYLILFIGLIFTGQLYINEFTKLDAARRYYKENIEFSEIAKTIKTRLSLNPDLKVGYYHNKSPADRLWKEGYIQYYSNFYNLKQFSKEELAGAIPNEDLVIWENTEDNEENYPPLLLETDYNLIYFGKLLKIYSRSAKQHNVKKPSAYRFTLL